MKQHFFSTLRSLVCAIAAAALSALTIALMLSLYDIPRTVELSILPWAALLLVQAVLCELLFARGVSMLVYIIASAALTIYGGERIVAATAFIPGSSGFPVLLRGLIYASGTANACAVLHPLKSNAFVHLGDALTLGTITYLVAAFSLGDALNVPILTFALTALTACMAATARLRAGGESDHVIRGSGAGGLLVLMALLGVCLLLCTGLLALSDAHVGSLVELLLQLWAFVCAAGRVLLETLARILAFLIPNPYYQDRQYRQTDSLALSGPMDAAAGHAPAWVSYVLMGLMAAAALIGVFALALVLRRMKIGRVGKTQSRRKVTRDSHARSALRALAKRIVEAISFEISYLSHKRTPQGLYVLARRAGRMKRLPQKRSESPGAYLRTLHGRLLAQGESSSLDRLADMLERALYAGETTSLTPKESAEFARQIRAIAAPQRTLQKSAS